MDTTKKILVVDDLDTERLAIVKKLQARGYTNIEQASDGQSAIDKANATKPDLIFMDIVMPNMNGFGAIRGIVKTNKTVPIVVVSSKDRAPDRVLAEDCGARDYVVKPISDEKMNEILAAFG